MSKLCHCAQEEGEGTPPDYEASPDACPGGADEEFPVQAQPCGNALQLKGRWAALERLCEPECPAVERSVRVFN
jgi:hypothetical protein